MHSCNQYGDPPKFAKKLNSKYLILTCGQSHYMDVRYGKWTKTLFAGYRHSLTAVSDISLNLVGERFFQSRPLGSSKLMFT